MAAAAAPAEPLEYELQQELSDIMIQGYISSLRRQFETKLCDNQNHIITLSKNWKESVSEIAALREELTGIVAAASEPSVKDAGEPPVVAYTNEAHYIPDFSLLKHMSGAEEINSFLKSEWLKLRREHESEMQKKTEELFRLKRDYAKDGAFLHFRKERELESVKSKVLQTISKMDGIISRKEGFNRFSYCNENAELCRLKDRIGSLLDENEHLRGLLADKRTEAQQLTAQVARHSLSESKLSNQVEKLSCELYDLKIESHLKDLLDGIISRKEGFNCCFDYNENADLCRLKDRIGSLLDENEHLRGLLADKRTEAQQLTAQVARHSLSESKLSDQVEKLSCELHDLKMESHLKDLLELTVLKEVFGDYENQIDDGNQEECLLRELIMEKEERLRVVSGDRHKLKYENDQLVSIVGSTLVQHHEEFDLVNDELTMFREKVCEQELLILEFKSESNSMKSCLYEALQQIHVCKEEITGLTESLASMSVALEEAKEQNASLDATIREVKRTSAMCVDSHGGHLEFDLVSMEKLSHAYSDFESRIAQSMKQTEIRLTSIMRQFNPLVQQVSVLKKKEFWYKQILEIKCSNLRKAEAEVDILGDEVDTFLNVLGKIYIALDHYSPVLKHYPGVTEILNLVQKVLKGESV